MNFIAPPLLFWNPGNAPKAPVLSNFLYIWCDQGSFFLHLSTITHGLIYMLRNSGRMTNVTVGVRTVIDVSFIGSYSSFLVLKVHLLVWSFLYNHFSSVPSWNFWQNLANTDLCLSSIILYVLGVWTHLAPPPSPWQYFWKRYCYC